MLHQQRWKSSRSFSFGHAVVDVHHATRCLDVPRSPAPEVEKNRPQGRYAYSLRKLQPGRSLPRNRCRQALRDALFQPTSLIVAPQAAIIGQSARYAFCLLLAPIEVGHLEQLHVLEEEYASNAFCDLLHRHLLLGPGGDTQHGVDLRQILVGLLQAEQIGAPDARQRGLRQTRSPWRALHRSQQAFLQVLIQLLVRRLHQRQRGHQRAAGPSAESKENQSEDAPGQAPRLQEGAARPMLVLAREGDEFPREAPGERPDNMRACLADVHRSFAKPSQNGSNQSDGAASSGDARNNCEGG
mmetsp:Transcript_98485/g.257251  ORF Transcript_98485/g.257251 Transcript_98485/m.257251 type:complete len:299 (-) Transcript_98485:82-978(-)